MYIKKTKWQMENDAYERARYGRFKVIRIDDNEFEIINLDKDTSYIVTLGRNNACTCPHFIYRDIDTCKHIVYIEENIRYI